MYFNKISAIFLQIKSFISRSKDRPADQHADQKIKKSKDLLIGQTLDQQINRRKTRIIYQQIKSLVNISSNQLN